MPRDKRAEELQEEVVRLTEALQRERADSMNVRRRSEEERAGLGNFYKSVIIKELLPTIDNFERAMKSKQFTANSKQQEDWLKGLISVFKQFEQALNKVGVKRIKTVGEVFDPNLHEAVAMEEGEGHKEVVSEELQAGYKLGDEVIRHAMVKVKAEK